MRKTLHESSSERQARALVGGVWMKGTALFNTYAPYQGSIFGTAPESTRDEVEAAVAEARKASIHVATASGRERGELLRRVAAVVVEHRQELAEVMAMEIGRAISDARREVDRCVTTLSLSADEAVRIEGQHVPMDATEIGANKLGVVLRYPRGVVAAITPFNAPLNLACHKIGPALAAGNSVVIKPAPQASVTVHKLIEAFHEAGTPAGWLNAVYGEEAGRFLVQSQHVDFISFTGSAGVGAMIRTAAPLKPVTLELGGNGFTIVHSDADLDGAANICARDSMRLAGQSCVSVQNVCVQRKVAARFEALLADRIAKIRVGDPLEEDVGLGPVISVQAAERICQSVDRAVAEGAVILCGGGARGALVQPTLLHLNEPKGEIFNEEIFGPVVNVIVYDDLEEPIDWINRGRYGLQTGVFAHSMGAALSLSRRLRVGAVILNGSSTWRSDQAPYGGVKDSGVGGREGPRYALREMTEERFVVFNY